MAATPTDGDLLVMLRALAPTLVPSMRRVAARILADPARASTGTISELAVAAETSETTVLRLCHQLGVSGYRDLRVALAAESGREQARAQREGTGPIGGNIGRDDDLDAIIEKITHADRQAIADSARILDRGALADAVELIANARRIDIIGVGASAVVALDLQQKLHRIGLIAYVWHDTHAALTAAALLTPDDVAIGISHTGATVDTIDAIRHAGGRGARTIGLTSVPRSELAAATELVLVTAGRETTFRSGATASRIAALSVVDVLFVAVAQRRYDAAAEALAATWGAVGSRRTPGYDQDPQA